MDRISIAALISARVQNEVERASSAYQDTANTIGYFVVDDLLPDDVAYAIAKKFPRDGLKLNNTMRERKFVSAQMNRHDPLIEEALFAFQDLNVVSLIASICRAPRIVPDRDLYAGGISAMNDGHFLNPHLDNSHDKDRNLWRTFNLLYYATPEWTETDGGSLELWPYGVKGRCVTIPALFNRLVVMATHDTSWHSVSPITSRKTRRCISNYYFSPEALRGPAFHITSFRGRPEQPGRDLALRVDTIARQLVRMVKPSGIGGKAHRYHR